MIGDNDMMITRAVEVPKEMSELSCGALVAGIIEAVMDGAGFVSIHYFSLSSSPFRFARREELLTLLSGWIDSRPE